MSQAWDEADVEQPGRPTTTRSPLATGAKDAVAVTAQTLLQEEKKILTWALMQLNSLENRHKKRLDDASSLSTRETIQEDASPSFPKASGSGGIPPYEEHLGESRQYWRDIILGVNDGTPNE